MKKQREYSSFRMKGSCEDIHVYRTITTSSLIIFTQDIHLLVVKVMYCLLSVSVVKLKTQFP